MSQFVSIPDEAIQYASQRLRARPSIAASVVELVGNKDAKGWTPDQITAHLAAWVGHPAANKTFVQGVLDRLP